MFASVRANKLSAGQQVLARVWKGNGKYDYVRTQVLEVPTGKLKEGTNGFVFEGFDNVPCKGAVKVNVDGKARRVTFLALKEQAFLALPAPESKKDAATATKRKPLTEEQKARKNELARARRAAARAAKKKEA